MTENYFSLMGPKSTSKRVLLSISCYESLPIALRLSTDIPEIFRDVSVVFNWIIFDRKGNRGSKKKFLCA